MTGWRSRPARKARRGRRRLLWLACALLVGLRIQHLDGPEPGESPSESPAALTAPVAESEVGPAPEPVPPAAPPEEPPSTPEPPAEPTTASDRSTEGQSSTRIVTMAELCTQIAAKLASVDFADCSDAGFAPTAGGSVNGRPLLARDAAADSPSGSLGRVLLIGGIHGDELSSVSIVFRWNRLLEALGTGPFDWRIVPALNPDGLLQGESSRLNANGVDLNRNFPTPNWHQATREYWVRRTSRNPRRYPGEAALSEPESRWLSRQIEDFQPDVIVSVHAPHGVLDFDGPPRAPERLGSLILQPIGTYPGSLGRYAGVQSGRRVVTIELSSAGIMPTPQEQGRIWEDLTRWLEERFLVDAGRHDGFLTGPRTSAGAG